MSDWPIGLSTGCFYRSSIFDCLESIRKGGFCMMEICSSPGHLNFHDIASVKKADTMIKKLGMEAYSFHAPFIDVDISSLDQAHRDYSLHQILAAAEAAAVLQVRHFVIHPGPDKVLQFSVEERMQRLRNAASILEKAARRCCELRVGLVIENMLPHLPFGSVSDLLWIMGAVENLNICTCLDTGHAALTGDLYTTMYKLSGHLRVVHVNDNLGTTDDHLVPGRGVINWQKLLFELGETNFHGGLIIELSGDSGSDIEGVLESARCARLHIRAIGRQLYLSTPPCVETPADSSS
jgi:sugar phosphate isomerase/epimerase